MLLSSEALLLDAANTVEVKSASESAVSQHVQPPEASVLDNTNPTVSDEDPELSMRSNGVDTAMEPENSSNHGGYYWQAICTFINRIYHAISHIFQQSRPETNHSSRLFQPVDNVQNGAMGVIERPTDLRIIKTSQ